MLSIIFYIVYFKVLSSFFLLVILVMKYFNVLNGFLKIDIVNLF